MACGVPGGELALRYQVLDHLGTPRLTVGSSLTPDSRFCYDPSIPANLDKLVYCRMEGLLERYHFDPFGTPLIESHQKTGPGGGMQANAAGMSGDSGGGWNGPPLAAGGTGDGDWSGALLAGENQTRFYSCHNGGENWCFTGKPREDAGDLFGARFYQYHHARWLSPDGPFADSHIEDPQSLNLYVYVSNNPVLKHDPNGRGGQVPHESNHWKIQGWKKMGMTDDQIREQMKADAQTGTFGAIVGLILPLAAQSPALFPVLYNFATKLSNSQGGQETVQTVAEWATGTQMPMNPVSALTGNIQRLSKAEFETGCLLAEKLGQNLRVSEHLGAEFISWTGKTIDAMGSTEAYKFWNPKQFLAAIDTHLLKSNDFTVINLNGASSSQIEVIQKYVGSLTKELQEKIIYVGGN